MNIIITFVLFSVIIHLILSKELKGNQNLNNIKFKEN